MLFHSIQNVWIEVWAKHKYWLKPWVTLVLMISVIQLLPTQKNTHLSLRKSSEHIRRWWFVLNHVWLFAIPWTIAHQAPRSMGFFRQDYLSGLPLPMPRDLPNPGTGPVSLMSLALTGRYFFTTNTTWKAMVFYQVETTKERIALEEKKFAYTTVIHLQCRRSGFYPRLGRSLGGRHGNIIEYSCLQNPHGQRSLAGHSPQGHKESDTTECLITHTCIVTCGLYSRDSINGTWVAPKSWFCWQKSL